MSNQIKNLKSRINKKKIKHLAVLFFSLFLTLAVFSQIAPKATSDVAFGSGKNLQPTTYNLQPTTYNLQPSDWMYYKSNNDITAYLGKKSSKLPTVRYQKGKNYLEFSMSGAGYSDSVSNSHNLQPTTYNLQPVSSTTAVSLETNVKEPNTPTLFYRNIFSDTDANYRITKLPFRVKEEIVLKKFPISNPPAGRAGFQFPINDQTSNFKIKNLDLIQNSKLEIQNSYLTFLFSAETTAKPVKQDDGSIAFFDGKGDYLFQLDKPFMVDANGNRSEDVSIEIVPVGETKLSQKNNGFNFKFRNSNFESIFNDLIFKHLNIPSFTQNSKFKIQNFNTEYQIILKADNEWLNDLSRAYPVIIDPTITHNADANFTGQFNRIADNDSTSSTQLESSYPEATKDPYTVLLLHFNEANGTTAGIRDYASTTRVITANGNASTTNYVTQLGLGNSAAFDGTGDYLSLANSSDWSLGTAGNGNYSIDFWTRWNSLGSATFAQVENGPQTDGWELRYKNSTNVMQLLAHGAEGAQVAWTPLVNNWYHVALIRSGSTVTLYIDGVSRGTFTDIDMTNNGYALTVGAANNGTQPLNGYLDEFRILKGRALTPEEIKAAASRRPYAVYTSPVLDASASVQWDTLNWTEGGVATGNGEQPYNTNSLVAQWDFNDTSGTTLTASSSGSCTTSCNGTLTNFSYTASQDQATTTTGWTANNKKWGGGSLMFDGSNDYVSVADNDGWTMGTGDFTMETWINRASLADDIVIAQGEASDRGFNFWVQATGVQFGYSVTAAATTYANFSYSFTTGIWYHVAVVRSGSDLKAYVNGNQIGSAYNIGSDNMRNSGGGLQIGAIYATPEYLFNGIIDSTRIYKGRALSAAEILSNYNAGNIEIQTRTGATSDPNDGTWEAWKPTTGETQLFSLDSDAVNWRSDIMASTTIATSTETVIKAEGTGSLKIRTGMASTTAGTVALWHFEETGTTTGTTLYDSTANANNATTTGTTVVDGVFGKARKFNGTSDYLSALDSANWAMGTGDFTFSWWMKFDSISGNIKFFEQGADVNNNQYLYLSSADGVLHYGQRSGGATNISHGVTDAKLTTNSWYNVVITRSGNTFSTYKNGLLIDTSTDADSVVDFAGSARLGAGIWEGQYFNGVLDEFAVYKGRALSADEIAETYRMGANHHLTRQVSATDLSAQTKLSFWIAADRPGTGLEAMLGESDYANYELASSTLALSTTTVLYIKGDEIASSTSIKDSSFSGKAITANGNARTSGNGKIGNSVYFDGTGDYLTTPSSSDFSFGSGDFAIDMWVYPTSNPNAITGVMGLGASGSDSLIYTKHSASSGNMQASMRDTGGVTYIYTTTPISLNVWQHIALVRNGNNLNFYLNSNLIGSADVTGKTMAASANALAIGIDEAAGAWPFLGYIDETRVIKGSTLTSDQIRQAYEYGLRTHPITIDFGATLQSSDLISSATDYNFSLTATTSGLSATTSGLYLGDKIIIKENLGGTEYAAQGTVNAINTATGAITVPSWDTGSTFPSGNGYSPNATVFKWQREYFDLTGAATTTRNAITNLTLRPTNGAEGRTIYLDDFRYNTNYLTASSSSAITSSNGRYLQYRAIFSSWDSFVSPYLSAFNTLYTSLATMFPPAIGVSGGGFLSF